MRIHTLRGRQRGVALMVALVVLVIIGLTSAAVMRGALSTDVVANNARTQTLAMQAAQIALRYCESELASPGGTTINILPAAADDAHAEWRTYASWSDDAKVNVVPDSYMESAHGTFSPDTMPQCMAQQLSIGGKAAFQVTSRGFSPDYTVDKLGYTESGSVVWVQSIIHL